MNEKFSVDDFISPLENLEHVLEMLEGFYSDGRFEDMDDALELIESYKRAVDLVRTIQGRPTVDEEWHNDYVYSNLNHGQGEDK